MSFYYILQHKVKILLFLKNNLKYFSFGVNQRKINSNPTKIPLLDAFRTFCWGEFIEELQNTYKLKELINLPVRVQNNI